MRPRPRLIGREALVAQLNAACASTVDGHGGLLLLAGEAGVGKTRLVAEALDTAPVLVIKPPPGPLAAPAYGPIVSTLRAFRRTNAQALAGGPLARYLCVLLPELGDPPPDVEQHTLFEAVCAAFEGIASQQPAVLFLDDLHEVDHATLELLAYLAQRLERVPLLILAAYRSDELARDHPLRVMRATLRRAGALREIIVEPLDPEATASLTASVLGRPPSDALAGLLYERTQGLPLFVEELASALSASGRLIPGEDGRTLGLADTAALLPVPETVRDIVLLGAARLDESARAALELAAVVGATFDADFVAEVLADPQALAEPFARGLLIEMDGAMCAFRHPLIRDAVYSDIPWPRRRALHAMVAQRLALGGAPAAALAEHWLAAREPDQARQALLAAASAACGVHAYRDAAAALRKALELWPEHGAEAERVEALEQLGRCAQLSGSLTDAVSAWREVAHAQRAAGQQALLAGVQRRLAGAFELQGVWEAALGAREAAAAAFAASQQPGEAAAERLAAAAHLRSAASFAPALELLHQAASEAVAAERIDLQARINALQGNILVRTGDRDTGLDQVRAALALALEQNLSTAAAEIYQRLADSLEHTGDYAAARQTYFSAAEFCQTHGAGAVAQLCLACATVVLRQTGEWERCEQVCRTVEATADASMHARTVALGMHGSIYAQRGDLARARPLLLHAARLAEHIELLPMQLLSLWGLALADDAEGEPGRAAERCRVMLARWTRTDERHYVIPALRWAATLFATQRDAEGTHACASALATIVGAVSDTEAVAALGHALGESTWLAGDAAAAVGHFRQAIERFQALGLPFERGHTALRMGAALLAAGQREAAVDRLSQAYRIAWTLGAQPLAAAAAAELARAGEPVEQRLGRRAAGLAGGRAHAPGGLSRRECEVAQLLAQGCTNREIAERLVVSERTAENHVQRLLNRLGVRSRVQVAAWAVEHHVA